MYEPNQPAHGFGAQRLPDYHAEPGPVSWQADESGDTDTEKATSLIRSAVAEHGKFLDRLEPIKHNYSADGYTAQVAGFADSQAGNAALDRAIELSSGRRAELESEYDHAFRELTAPAHAAQELRNQRTADRADREMQKAPEDQKSTTARRLIREAADDPAAVGVLVAELPSMGADASVVAHAATEALPQLADKAAKVGKARQAETVVKVEAERVRGHFKTGRRLQVPLVDPSKYDPDK
jgi:hypothetical protein